MAEESMEVKFEKKEMKRERKCKKLNKHQRRVDTVSKLKVKDQVEVLEEVTMELVEVVAMEIKIVMEGVMVQDMVIRITMEVEEVVDGDSFYINKIIVCKHKEFKFFKKYKDLF